MSGTTYTAATTAKLNREDLSDIISVVDARSTIVTSMIKKGKKPESALSEWIVDSYGSAKTSGVVDGTDASGSTTNFEDFSSNRKRAQNYLQTFRRTPLVTRLQEIVAQPAGISNPDPNGASGSTEFGRAKSKAVIQLKRDIESAILSDNGAQADDGSAQPFITRALGSWLSTTADSVLGQDTSILLNTNQVYAAALTSFNEDKLRTALQQRWNTSGEMKELVGIMSPGLKNAVSDFTRYLPTKSNFGQVRYFDQSVPDKTITTAVDVYEGDYGTVKLFLSPWLPAQVTGLSYTISTNTVTVTSTAHGLQKGALIQVSGDSNTSQITTGFYRILSAATDTFTFTRSGTGTTAGTLTYGDNRGYILDMDYLELRTALAPSYLPLPDLGAGPRGIVEAIVSLAYLNPTSGIKIAAY